MSKLRKNLVGEDYECFAILKGPYLLLERVLFIWNCLVFTYSERSCSQFLSADHGMRLFCIIESAEPLPNSRFQSISEVELISLKAYHEDIIRMVVFFRF